MSNFKQHIRECFFTKTNITIEMDHLKEITFEDICMLIHIISVEKLDVILSEDVKKYLRYGCKIHIWDDLRR